MENSVSRDVYVHKHERRRIHGRAILEAQRRQIILNIHNDEQLSLLSERSSELGMDSLESLHDSAAKYWDILKK